MLRVYEDALVVCRGCRPVLGVLERRDADLARQLRRAAASMVLNIREASGQRGGNQRRHFSIACGSAEEVRACFDVGEALGYLTPVEEGLADRLDKVVRTLAVLSRR